MNAPSTFTEMIGLGALIVSVSTFVAMTMGRRHERWKETRAEWDGKYQRVQEQHAVVTNWLTAIDKEVGILKAQIEIFWKGVAYSSAQILHSPHTPELDRLIEKFQEDQLNADELREFQHQLQCIWHDPAEENWRKREAYLLLTVLHIQYDMGESVATLTPGAYREQALYGDIHRMVQQAEQMQPQSRPDIQR